MEKPTPRISASMIQQYPNMAVRVAGRVVKTQGSSFILETSDGNTVLVNPVAECTYSGSLVEVVGKVESDGTICGFTAIDLSDNFDLQAYGLLETAQQKCPGIFGLN